MPSLSFLLGDGKLRLWYIAFYLFALPLYIFGTYLLTQLSAESSPQTRELVLNILSFGYLLLGIFSLVNTIIYIHITKKFFWGFLIFFGIQVLFWGTGYFLGNNYGALTVFFTMFLTIAVYANLKALSFTQKKSHESKKTD